MPKLQQDIEDALLAGNWTVDCVKMTLTQNESKYPETISGKGYLRQDESEHVQFRIYPDSDAPIPFPEQVDFGTPGKLIPPDGYSTLVATDFYGREWRCQRVRHDKAITYQNGGCYSIVSGAAYDLQCVAPSVYPPTFGQLRLVFFAEAEIPAISVSEVVTSLDGNERQRITSMRGAAFETDFGRFTIEQAEGKLVINCDYAELPQDNFFIRVMEALCFAIGKRMYWNYVEEYRANNLIRRVRGVKQSDKKSLVLPIGDKYLGASSTWKMFSKYLSFANLHKGGDLHKCTRHLFSVYQARQGTIEAQALALGVAAEGLSTDLFPLSSKVSSERKAWMARLRAYCDAWDGFNEQGIKDAFQKRLPGLLDQMNSPSARDKLMRLVREGVLAERHVEAWKKLRNQAAHAGLNKSGSTQVLVDLCQATTVLLYQLVFKAIAYEGFYTDYSEYGFPIKMFRGRWPTHDEKSTAAYYLYLRHPEVHGQDKAHWICAEDSLLSGQS